MSLYGVCFHFFGAIIYFVSILFSLKLFSIQVSSFFRKVIIFRYLLAIPHAQPGVNCLGGDQYFQLR